MSYIMFVSVMVVFALTLGLLSFLVWKLYKEEILVLKKENIAMRDLVTSAEYGFYIWNGETRTDEFSPNMQLIFHTVFCSFDEFADIFEESEKLKNEVRIAKKSIHSFSLILKAKEFNNHYKCYGKSSLGVNVHMDEIACIMLWISNISEEKDRVSQLETENIKLKDRIERIDSLINEMPLPLWKKDGNDKVIYNNFYKKFIKNNISNTKKVHGISSEQGKGNKVSEVSIVINNRSKYYKLTEIDHNGYVLGYGQDITKMKELEERMKSYLSTQKELISNLASPIAIYSRDQVLQEYNLPFLKMYKLDEKKIRELSSFQSILDHAIENDIFDGSQANLLTYKTELSKLFDNIMEPHHSAVKMKNNTVYKMLVVPNALGGLLFIYECIGNFIDK